MEKKQIKREFSAGGVVYKKLGDQIFWLVIRPKGSEKWRLPKGWIEKGESSKEAAVREVLEEGGVETNVLAKIGTEQYFFVLKGERIFKNVTFYLMEYIKEAETEISWETEEIDWLSFELAREWLAFKTEKEMLEKGNNFTKEIH